MTVHQRKSHKRPRGAKTIKSRKYLVVVLLVSGLLLAAFAAVTGRVKQSAPGVPAQATRQVEAFRATRGILLPSAIPPDTVNLRARSIDGLAVVLFYSLAEPTVAICFAPSKSCQQAMPLAMELHRQAPRPDASVFVLPTGDTDRAAPSLSQKGMRFWRGVDLVTGQPGWLAASK